VDPAARDLDQRQLGNDGRASVEVTASIAFTITNRLAVAVRSVLVKKAQQSNGLALCDTRALRKCSVQQRAPYSGWGSGG
jgi:hypothetical protein